MMEAVLELKNVTCRDRSGRTVLRRIDMELGRGERLRVLGGRGELAALAMVAGGVYGPDSGEALILGRRVYEMEAWEAAAYRSGSVGYASGAPGFWRGLTVLENAAMPLTVRGASRREREAAAWEALETVGMGYAAHVYPKSLTVCELRLAALARAAVSEPPLLVLEDVLEGLDYLEADRTAKAIQSVWEAGQSALLILAERDEGLVAADRTVSIAFGSIGGESK